MSVLKTYSPSYLPTYRAPNRALNSSPSLFTDANKIYKEKIRDPKRIMPQEVDAYPKLPSVTNLFTALPDAYTATKSLIHSIKQSDSEGAQDASAALLAVPINVGSSVGTLLDYGVGLKILPHSFTALLTPTYILGLVLCTIQGMIDTLGLSRQVSFGNEFDFELLKNLKILSEKPDTTTGYKAFTKVLSILKKSKDGIEEVYGKEDSQALYKFLGDLKEALDERPHYRKFILEQFESEFKELTQVALSTNLLHLQEKYLQLNPSEVKKIAAHVEKKYHDRPVEKQREKLSQGLEKALNKKRKNLARRVRPWMVHEAVDTNHSILMGLTSENKDNKDLAIQEGLTLMNDMRLQNMKKKIVHVIGILAFVIAAASLITLLAGCPYVIPVILMTVATIVATGRFLAFASSLDTRGWDFSLKDTLPDFIRNRIYDDRSLNHPSMLSQRKVTPLTKIYDPPISSALS